MHRYYSHTLMVVGLGTVLATGACSKQVAVLPPVQATPQAVAQTPARTAPQQTATAKPRALEQQALTAARPQTMAKEERRTLEESLARMEDALFDYDRSTIRPDAMQALRQD